MKIVPNKQQGDACSRKLFSPCQAAAEAVEASLECCKMFVLHKKEEEGEKWLFSTGILKALALWVKAMLMLGSTSHLYLFLMKTRI